jgi:hypothetical protein
MPYLKLGGTEFEAKFHVKRFYPIFKNNPPLLGWRVFLTLSKGAVAAS